MISILHISDLHIIAGAVWNNMRTTLLEEARSVIHDRPIGKKLLIITGDFHNFEDKDYQAAKSFLKELFEAMAIDPAQDVFVVPGNHDVGNDESMKAHFALGDDWKMRQESSVLQIKNSQMTYLKWRLESFLPYCKFVQDLGIYYEEDMGTLPAQVHVRNWRGKLNLLHLNTALIADGSTKDDQRVDTDTASGEKIWEAYFREDIPALALGHNSFFDLEKKQQTQLIPVFKRKNISAYLCGDTHKKEVDRDRQKIRLESGYTESQDIPNIVCVKGAADAFDNYSDFGFYWHDWDEKTNVVSLRFNRWNREVDQAKFVPEGEIGRYSMFCKYTDVAPSKAWLKDPDLCAFLHGLLCRTRDAHPSFRLMQADKIDKRLFPNIQETMAFEPKGNLFDGKAVSPIWDLIAESWASEKNRSVVIQGGGGIGKTVTLLSIAERPDGISPIPAVYIPLFDLVDWDGTCLSISDYLARLTPEYATPIGKLAATDWDYGPSLLVLLDGFNEVPVPKRRPLLYKLNDWHLAHPGAQLIAVSRPIDGIDLCQELSGDPISLSLTPLNREIVQKYLNTLGGKEPAASSPIWEVLVYPLFLTLYVKTENLKQVDAGGYPVDLRKADGPGALVWNYLQRELLRKRSEKWVLRCSVACEYILPYIAFYMSQKHLSTIGQGDIVRLIRDTMERLDSASLPNHLSTVFETYVDNHYAMPDMDEIRWIDIVLHETGIMLPYSGSADIEPHTKQKRLKKRYTFTHQIFRDCLAGLHLVNQAESAAYNSLPELWRHSHAPAILGYAAELMDEDSSTKLWNANRNLRPTNKSSTYAMLELQKCRRNLGFSTLDFSGMDLRGISLTRYLSLQCGALNLFRQPELTRNTVMDLAVFRGQGHSGTVQCIAVAPDGICITGSTDGTLRVWDPNSGGCLHELKGHTGAVNCVAITSNGICISGSDDHIVRVWDFYTGTCLCALKGHTGSVNCVAIALDGTCISGSDDHFLRVWDLQTQKCLYKLKGHVGSVNCVAISPDGTCISGSDDHTLHVWDLQTKKCLYKLNGHIAPISCVAIAPDGVCISGSSDHTLRVWDLQTREFLYELKEHTAPISCVAIAPDGVCVSGANDKTLRIWDLNAKECLHVLRGHTWQVNCVAMALDGTCISASNDMTLRVWNLRSGECLHVMKRDTVGINDIDITPRGICVSVSSDKMLRVWNLNTMEPLRTLKMDSDWVRCVAIDPDGCCVTGADDCTIRQWDPCDGKKFLHELNGHTGSINDIAVTADGHCVSASSDMTLRVWNLNADECLFTLKGHSGSINSVAVTSDGICISASNDKTLRIWNLRTKSFLRELTGHSEQVTCVATTSDGICVSGSIDKTLRIWNIHTGECLRVLNGHSTPVCCIAVAPGGICVSGSTDGTLRVWNIHTGECNYLMEGHSGPVNCVAITSNGICVSGSFDNTLRLWDYHTGSCKHILRIPEVDVSTMDLSFALLDPPLADMLRQNGAIVPDSVC